MVVNQHVGAGSEIPVPSKSRWVLLTTEPALQPLAFFNGLLLWVRPHIANVMESMQTTWR